MDNINIAVVEGTRDSTGRLVQVGDIVDVIGYRLADGTVCGETITTVRAKIDINDLASKENAQ